MLSASPAVAQLPHKQQAVIIFLAAAGDGSGIPEDDLVVIGQKLSALSRDKSVAIRRLAAKTQSAIEARESKRPN